MKGSPKGDSFVIGQNITLQTHSRGPVWPDRITPDPVRITQTNICAKKFFLINLKKGLDIIEQRCYTLIIKGKEKKQCIDSHTSTQVLNGHLQHSLKQSNILKLSKDKKSSKSEDRPQGLFFYLRKRTYVRLRPGRSSPGPAALYGFSYKKFLKSY